MAALQKRTPPCCCALAVDVAPCRSARRRAVVPSGCQRARSVKATVAPALVWAALQKRAPPSCCALAGTVALYKSVRRRAIFSISRVLLLARSAAFAGAKRRSHWREAPLSLARSAALTGAKRRLQRLGARGPPGNPPVTNGPIFENARI